MTITNQTAWLERTWLDTSWLGADIEDSTNMQVELKIPDVLSPINAQAELKIVTDQPVNSQAELKINTQHITPMQTEIGLNVEEPVAAQVELKIVDVLNGNFTQARPFIELQNNNRQQVEQIIVDALKTTGAQVDLKVVDDLHIKGAEVYSSNLYWVRCGGWLETAWLTKAWLARRICPGSRQQVELRIDTQINVGAQVELKIVDVEHGIYNQVEMKIDVITDVGAQANLQTIERIPSQVLISLYNVVRPRIMCQFPSRGTTGLNWTASSTEPGDFSILNVNNDISEFYYRSASGVTTINLDCDTEITQGIFMDTFYAEGHNLTSSATVVFEGTNDPTYTTISWTENLTPQDDKIFYVEPALPLTSYRYWRLRISDPTNTDGFVKIGTIIFGASNILNSECATQDIVVAPREFKNTLRTEGFTSVGNSRSLKRSIKLDFRSISYDSGDYDTLNNVINYSRTTLKCLWIPDPRSQSLMKRFAVFGKIKGIPSQKHNVKGINENMDFIDFTIEIDEAE